MNESPPHDAVDVGRTPADVRNVVLTGFMGTGKSTVGRILAARLGFEFVDTDVLIEDREGPISTIFDERGEDVFRSIERSVAAELADRTSLVVATGGRLMLDPENAATLGRDGRVFCLVASVDTIESRVLADAARFERPLLTTPDPRRRITELLAERAPAYDRFPRVETDGRTPDDIAAEIVGRLPAATT